MEFYLNGSRNVHEARFHDGPLYFMILMLEIFQKALSSPGCAFEARESRASIDAALNAMAYHNACFEAAIGDEPRDGFGYDGND